MHLLRGDISRNLKKIYLTDIEYLRLFVLILTSKVSFNIRITYTYIFAVVFYIRISQEAYFKYNSIFEYYNLYKVNKKSTF